MNVFLGRKHKLFLPSMITSTTVTLTQMMELLDENKYREAFVILLMLTDIVPSYIV